MAAKVCDVCSKTGSVIPATSDKTLSLCNSCHDIDYSVQSKDYDGSLGSCDLHPDQARLSACLDCATIICGKCKPQHSSHIYKKIARLNDEEVGILDATAVLKLKRHSVLLKGKLTLISKLHNIKMDEYKVTHLKVSQMDYINPDLIDIVNKAFAKYFEEIVDPLRDVACELINPLLAESLRLQEVVASKTHYPRHLRLLFLHNTLSSFKIDERMLTCTIRDLEEHSIPRMDEKAKYLMSVDSLLARLRYRLPNTHKTEFQKISTVSLPHGDIPPLWTTISKHGADKCHHFVICGTNSFYDIQIHDGSDQLELHEIVCPNIENPKLVQFVRFGAGKYYLIYDGPVDGRHVIKRIPIEPPYTVDESFVVPHEPNCLFPYLQYLFVGCRNVLYIFQCKDFYPPTLMEVVRKKETDGWVRAISGCKAGRCALTSTPDNRCFAYLWEWDEPKRGPKFSLGDNHIDIWDDNPNQKLRIELPFFAHCLYGEYDHIYMGIDQGVIRVPVKDNSISLNDAVTVLGPDDGLDGTPVSISISLLCTKGGNEYHMIVATRDGKVYLFKKIA